MQYTFKTFFLTLTNNKIGSTNNQKKAQDISCRKLARKDIGFSLYFRDTHANSSVQALNTDDRGVEFFNLVKPMISFGKLNIHTHAPVELGTSPPLHAGECDFPANYQKLHQTEPFLWVLYQPVQFTLQRFQGISNIEEYYDGNRQVTCMGCQPFQKRILNLTFLFDPCLGYFFFSPSAPNAVLKRSQGQPEGGMYGIGEDPAPAWLMVTSS